MFLAEVVGTVVSPVAVPELMGRTHLIVRPVTPDGKATGKTKVAIDSVGAGLGDRVLIVDEGGSARQVLADPDAGIRTVIVGFVDSVSMHGENVYEHGASA
ncbi:MAG: EutN/CcmL family microcompartment protein [Planctomycetes bacterium]|nr:EutN/CcmL family microcompartment protein [Planctomycetota bacterium]